MTLTAVLRCVALITVTWACRSPEPTKPLPAPATQALEMARDQWFFAAQTPEPVLLALILQRTRDREATATTLEAKAFLVARDRLQSLFWERVELDRWPGEDLATVLTAWQKQRKGPGLRLAFATEPAGLTLTVRQPAGGFTLTATDLQPIGTTNDPHGESQLRAGTGQLEVNGVKWQGQVLAEHLEPGSRAWPSFGRFEMWLAAPTEGGLVLGRCDLRAPPPCGEAVVLSPGQPPLRQGFAVQPFDAQRDVTTGFLLPRRWRLEPMAGGEVVWRDGQTGRGRAPGGSQAVYDIGVASGPGALALVFHLQDQ